jgi:hypothetical protein
MDNQFTCFICGGDHLPNPIDEGRQESWFWVNYVCPVTGDGCLQWAGIDAIRKVTRLYEHGDSFSVTYCSEA